MINYLGGLIGAISNLIAIYKEQEHLYSDEQIRAFEALEGHYLRDEDYSSSMSWYSSSASSSREVSREIKGKGTAYWDDLEKRC